MASEAIEFLVQYGVEKGLLEETDREYAVNRILEIMQMDDYNSGKKTQRSFSLQSCLEELLCVAEKRGILERDRSDLRDLFDTKLMGAITPRPSEVIRKFWDEYKKSPEAATEYFYNFSQDTNYIRRDRIKKDMKWKALTDYGELDITINLSKPEKDPKAIAAAKSQPKSGYPLCLLCKENVGYAGNLKSPARQNHRVIPVPLSGENWGLQYSPYVYYPEHCILFCPEHTPMRMNEQTFERLFDFISVFPHYFIGSNAEIPIVGGSILSHYHFQGGHYTFAMEKAEVEETFSVKGYEGVAAGILKWPMSVIRLSGKDREPLQKLAGIILKTWRDYSDPNCDIYAKTDGEGHNTITPIARKRGDNFELDLVLRNNRTTKEHPLGIFHPHKELHHIKKENIGLIEVMGLAVLPARLRREMEILQQAILEGSDLDNIEEIKSHVPWVKSWIKNYPSVNSKNLPDILKKEIGLVFLQVLTDAGVFKRTPEGKAGFHKFLEQVKKKAEEEK